MKWPERLGFEKSVAAWFEMKACISRSVNKQIQPLDQNTWLEDVTFAQQFEINSSSFFSFFFLQINRLISPTKHPLLTLVKIHLDRKLHDATKDCHGGAFEKSLQRV